jgi:hypothetical protein
MANRGELGDTVAKMFEVRQRLWVGWIRWAQWLGGSGAVICGIIVFVSEAKYLTPVLILGASVLLSCVALVAALARRRVFWRITEFEKGLEIVGRSGTRAVAFSEVAALGLRTRDEFTNGSFAGTSRRLQLWRERDPVRQPYVDLETFCKADQPEAESLAQAVDRLVEQATARIGRVLANGGSVKGVGMQLSPTALRVGADTLPLDSITTTGLFGGKLCLWIGAEAEPRHRLDPGQPNVLPMVRVIQKRIDERRRPDGEAVPGLGRVLFERRGSSVTAAVLLVLGIATVWLGIGLFLIMAGLQFVRYRFRCHERGVFYRGLFRRSELLYRNLSSFTFSAVRQYYKGGYIGTSIRMVFVPDPSPGAKPIRFSRSIRNADSDLEVLREHVAAVVGAKLLDKLKREGEIPWSPAAVITTRVLRYRPAKLIGKGDWTDLPLEEVAGTALDQGVLSVFAKGRDKPVLALQATGANFFPGLYAFAHLTEAAAAAQRATGIGVSPRPAAPT